MGEVHRRVHHLVGTNLFSSAYAHDKHPPLPPPPRPLLLRHKIGWKHLQEPADFDRLEEFNGAVRSDRMSSVTGVVVVDGGGREKTPTATRIHVPAAPERGEVAAGGASAPARTANGGFIIHSPSRTSAAAPPPGDDDVLRECHRTDPAIEAHRLVPAPAGDEFCCAGGDQDAGQSSRPSPSGKRSPSSDTTMPDAADDASGVDVNLYQKGLAAAAAMDEETLLSEVAKYIGVEADQNQRPQRLRRAARRRKTAAPTKAAAPPVYFSLRLTDEEAMEDVLAVSVPKNVISEAQPQPPPPPVHRNGKRRRKPSGR